MKSDPEASEGYRTFEFPGGKLVYDGWIADNKAIGAKVAYKIRRGEELRVALRSKLEEELCELEQATTDEEKAKEQRDINDIRFALGELSVQEYEPKKTFTLGIFALSVSLPNDPSNREAAHWIEYYSGDHERFVEVQTG